MKKSDLKTGMIIETRAGETGLIMKDNCYGEDAVVFADDNWTGLNRFLEDMTWTGATGGVSDYCKTVDIMKVFTPDLPSGFLKRDSKFKSWAPIWERKEIPEFTMTELIKKLGFEFKIKK